jgi:hypothetical protein
MLFLFICGFLAAGAAIAQIQLGDDIDGEEAGESSGFSVSVSADGNRLAIGAPTNDDNGRVSGQVRVYEWSGTAWLQLGGGIDGEAAGDYFGESLSLSADGNRVAIGSKESDSSAERSGQVRVYQWSGTGWLQLGDNIDGEAAGDHSGWSVSLSADGNLLAIGAPYHGRAWNIFRSGQVRVYQWSGTGWLQLGEDILGEAESESSGFSVSLSASGNRLAIGAITNNDNGRESGQVRVYEWSGTAWLKLGGGIDGEASRDYSGWSVSLSADGNRVAIGSKESDSSAERSGQVRVYQWSGTGWLQLGDNIDGEEAGDQSGSSVSLSADGGWLAIGAKFNDGNGSPATGHVRVYRYSVLSDDWIQFGDDIDGEVDHDWSGSSVSLSADGSLLAIGAPYNHGNGGASGHVRVYEIFEKQPDLAGDVETESGVGVCAMVLASGQYMFSCNPNGPYTLNNLSRELDGSVKRQVYADGFFPRIDVLPSTSFETVVMERSGTCSNYNLPYIPDTFPDSAGKRQAISGRVLLQSTDMPICAMVLANGAYMFSCDGSGRYSLEFPLDSKGQFKLQVYADGFAPSAQSFDEFSQGGDVRMARARECQ